MKILVIRFLDVLIKMSILFEPLKIGEMEVRNRFVRSATVEKYGKREW